VLDFLGLKMLLSAWQKTLNFQKSLTASRTLDV
jgi:hypothetical protein